MATWATQRMSPLQNNGRETFKTITTKTGETFEQGACVLTEASSGGLVAAECGADPAAIAGVSLAGVSDYSWEDDTFNTVNPKTRIAPATQIFRGTMLGTWAATDEGVSYGLLDSSGIWVIDKAETTNTRVRVLRADDDVVAGDINPPVEFVFLSANIQPVGG